MNNIKIGTRLIISFLLIALFTCAVGYIGYEGIKETKQSADSVTKVFLPSIEALAQVKFNMRNVILAQHILLIKDISAEKRSVQYQNIEKARKLYKEGIAIYEKLPQTTDEKNAWDDFKSQLDKATAANIKGFELIKEWEKDISNGAKYQIAQKHIVYDTPETNQKLFESIETVININSLNSKLELKKTDSQYSDVSKELAYATLICSISALLLGLILTKSIINPIKKGLIFAEKVKNGQFSARLDLKQTDELGVLALNLNQAFEKATENMFWYENIINAIPFPVSVTDNNMKWTFLNKAVEDIAKVKASEMLGKNCNNWGANICNTDNCGVRCAERGNGQGRSYFTQPQFPGKEFLVDCSFIYNNKKEKIGYIEVIQDITEANDAKRQAEQALKNGIAQAAQQLESIVEIVTSASEQLSAQVEQSSRGSEEQAQSISETAAAMEEMNATVLEVAKNASNAAGTADQAKIKAEEGARVVTQVIQGIGQVQNQSQEMKIDMDNLGKQAEGIGQILNVISDIADQTNLLALNAAIEAARAGDAGRGFAVVADEVRKLAEKTMTATKEVGNAIRGIQDGTKKNIENVERTGKNIEEVTNLATNSGEALKQIVTLAEKTTDQVRSIATASEQQSATSEEINRSIESVNRISSETADAMRQSAQAVTELANQAQVLKRLIEDMKSDGGSSASALPAGKRPLALGK